MICEACKELPKEELPKDRTSFLCRLPKCKCCNKTKRECDFPETVEEHAKRRHLSLEEARCNMICESCKELAFSACASCGIRRAVEDGVVLETDKMVVVQDEVTRKEWYCE